MHVVQRAAKAYYRANIQAWVALKRLLPTSLDAWQIAAVANFCAVLALVDQGRSDIAMYLAAAGILLLAAQYTVDR